MPILIKMSLLIIFSFGNYVLLKIIIFFASSNLKNEEL